MEYIIGVQGFKKTYNSFVFKELAIIPLGEDVQPVVYSFGVSHDWNFLSPRYKFENKWLTKNYHGFCWQDGEIPYEEFEEIIKSSTRGAGTIWVKGLEKQKWLTPFLSNVQNIETLSCPPLSKLHQKTDDICSSHNQGICFNSNCAARNVIALKRWLIEFYDGPAFTMYKERVSESGDTVY